MCSQIKLLARRRRITDWASSLIDRCARAPIRHDSPDDHLTAFSRSGDVPRLIQCFSGPALPVADVPLAAAETTPG